MTSVKEMALVEAEPQALSLISLIDRAARDESVDVEKMDRLMQMYERTTARLAQEAFNGAMSAAQTEMRPVASDATNPQTRSKYASYAALDGKMRPIYTKHGFGLSFDTGECPRESWVRVLCYVTHTGGFARTYHADMPADGKGAKGGDVMTQTHAVGAAMSYGMRYLLKMIFNVAVGEDDRDGNAPTGHVTDPAGFKDWRDDLEIIAKEQGLPALQAAWKKSSEAFRLHTNEHYRTGWEATKALAAKVQAV